MSSSFEFDPADRITVGTVGPAGQRVFYVQASGEGRLVTLVAEKGQIQALAITLARLLSVLEEVEDEGREVTDEEMELVEPLLPEWRAGAMGLDYDETGNRIVLVIHEIVPFTDEEEGAEETGIEEPPPEGGTMRVGMTRAQARALAIHAEEVCAAGRPHCRFCGLPMDPEGHVCPATNGHRETKI